MSCSGAAPCHLLAPIWGVRDRTGRLAHSELDMNSRSALATGKLESVPAANPDAARLKHMFEAHHELVWRTLRRRGLGPDAAADATQQAFLIAAERMDDIRHGSERAFLIGTALRLARSFLRRAGRLQFEIDMDLRVSPAHSAIDDRAAVELFDLALSKLEPTLADVFVLYELNGFSSPEIAKMVDVPVGTVASRLRRARQEFREEAARLEQGLKREETK